MRVVQGRLRSAQERTRYNLRTEVLARDGASLQGCAWTWSVHAAPHCTHGCVSSTRLESGASYSQMDLIRAPW